jgi:hypothetical protein
MDVFCLQVGWYLKVGILYRSELKLNLTFRSELNFRQVAVIEFIDDWGAALKAISLLGLDDQDARTVLANYPSPL